MWNFRDLFFSVFGLSLMGCDAINVQNEQDAQPISAAQAFDSDSAQSVNCHLMGYLSELEYEGKASGANCGHIDKNGLVKFTDEFMALNPLQGHEENGYVCFPINRSLGGNARDYLGWFYVTPEGYGRGHSETYDNDCPRWEWLPGIAKIYVGEKLAYMNKSLKIIHQTEYPFGENFSKETNLAIVCSIKPTKRLGPHKEHFAYLGGKCGQINLKFETVTPIKQPFEDFVPIPEWAMPFYTRDAKIITKPGKAEELKLILEESFENLIGLDRVDIWIDRHVADQLFVSERWQSRSAHTKSLNNPKVQDAISKGRPLILSFENQREHEYDPENGKY